MKHRVSFIIALVVLCPNIMLAQKVINYLEINIGAGVYSSSMLFPYVSNNTGTNKTGEIQFSRANPVWSIGFGYERVYKKGLALKTSLSYQSMRYAFNTANDYFEYVDNILIAYLTFDFNKVEYQMNTVATDFLIGAKFLENRKLSLNFILGPRVLYNFNSSYNHSPGAVYTNGVTDLENYIGLTHISKFMIGLTASPQVFIKLNSSLKLSSSLNLSYYFKPFVEYNSAFNGMISSPFKENTFPYVSGVFQIGFAYEI